MRTKAILTIVPLLMVCLLIAPFISLAGQFKVTRVYDGDTIMAEGHDITIYVLLAGIDAPEIDPQRHQQQPYGQEAKRYLETTVLNKTVEIKGYGIGAYPYNHLVGEIYVSGQNINIEMVKQGFAEVFHEMQPDGLHIAPYLEAEKKAKDAQKGIWSLGDRYISPQEWRKAYKKK